jgi:uncharacterized protein
MDILPLPVGLVAGLATDISASAMNEGPGRQGRWQELTRGECFGLLARQQVGRVAVVDVRGPVVFRVNFVFDRHMVVFHTDEGTKLDAAARCSKVAFEIDGIDAAAHTGSSVVVRDGAVEVTDQQELACLRELPLLPWAPGARSRYVRILPAKLTDRRISRLGGPSGRGGCPLPEAAARGRR